MIGARITRWARRDPLLAVTVGLAALAMAAMTAWALTNPRPDEQITDSAKVTRGARVIVQCVKDGTFSNCDQYGRPPGVSEAVGPYPPTQYAISIVSVSVFNASNRRALNVLQWVNLAAMAAMLAMMIAVGVRIGRRWAPPLLAALIVVSPLAYFSGETFAEPLATALILGLAVAGLLRAPPWALFLATVAAATTKETMAPFVLVMAGVALWATPLTDRRLTRGHWVALGGGLATAAAILLGFNWFRYEQLTNRNYTTSFFQTEGLGDQLAFGASTLFAPNGGMLWFWPLAFALVVALGVIGVRNLRADRSSWALWVPGTAMVALFLVQALALGRWYSPFGWVSYGPRLSLPITPALVVIGVACHREPIEAAIRRLLARPWRTDLVAVGLAVFALPAIVVRFHFESFVKLFADDATCRPGIDATMPGPYNDCLLHRAWEYDLFLVDTLHGLNQAGGALLGLIFATVAIGLTIALRAGLFQDDRP